MNDLVLTPQPYSFAGSTGANTRIRTGCAFNELSILAERNAYDRPACP